MQKKETIHLKNMFSRSCMKLIELSCHSHQNVKILKISLGEVRVEYDDLKTSKNKLIKCFEELGFESIKNPEEELVEKTKVAAIELIYKALNSNSLIRNSEYISDKLLLPYGKISRVFSKVTGTPLEKYIILLKIEKAKEMLCNQEYNISEIAYKMGYSSVQYFSNQFKRTVGITVSQFKKKPHAHRKALEEII